MCLDLIICPSITMIPYFGHIFWVDNGGNLVLYVIRFSQMSLLINWTYLWLELLVRRLYLVFRLKS